MEPKKPIKKNKTDFVPLTLRLPPALHASIVEQAAAANKSLNEYIISSLFKLFEIEQDALDIRVADLETIVSELKNMLNELESRIATHSTVAPSDIATLTIDPADFPPGAKE